MPRRGVDPKTGLTPAQEIFCTELVRSGNACEAYRKAYPNSKAKPNALAVAAHELQKKPNISVRLSQLRSDVRKAGVVSLVEHVTTLAALREEARAARQFSAAITAEVSIGKVSGLYEGTGDETDAPPVARVEIQVTDARKK